MKKPSLSSLSLTQRRALWVMKLGGSIHWDVLMPPLLVDKDQKCSDIGDATVSVLRKKGLIDFKSFPSKGQIYTLTPLGESLARNIEEYPK